MKRIYKAADTSRLGTAVPTADPDLQFPLEANSRYIVRGQMYLKGSSAGGIQHGFSLGGASLLRGGGGSWKWRTTQPDTTQTAAENGAPWTLENLTSNGCRAVGVADGAYSMPVSFVLMLDIGGTPGTFSVIWAQTVADAFNPAKVLAGAVMTYEKLP